MPRPKITLTKEQILTAIEKSNSWSEVAEICNCSENILRRERERLDIESEFEEGEFSWVDKILSTKQEEKTKLFKHEIKVKNGLNSNLIIPFGDTHYGHEECDEPFLAKILKWLYKHDETHVIGMGDLIESSIIGSPGLFDQKEFVNSQVYNIVELLSPIAEEGRLLGIHNGNHEHRVRKKTGFDIAQMIAKMLDVPYLGEGAAHLITVYDSGGEETYELYTTHGSSRAQYPHTKMNACIKLDRIIDVECYCMAHTHSLGHQKIDRYKIDREIETLVKEPRHYLLTGSYLKYWGSYAHMKGYQPSGDAGSPKIKLHVDTHRISVSL